MSWRTRNVSQSVSFDHYPKEYRTAVDTFVLPVGIDA